MINIMKKFLLKFSIVAVLITTLSSCEEDKVIYNGSGSSSLAAFASNIGGIAITNESSSTTVVVTVADLVNVDRTIVLSVDSESTALPTDYEIASSSLVIPANSYKGEIIINANPDAFESGDIRTLILKLESVGEAYVSTATCTLKIFKSCPFDATQIGTDFTGSTYIEGDYVSEFIPAMTQSTTNPNVFTFTSLWGPNFVAEATGNPAYLNQYLYPGTMTINSDLSLTITTSFAQGGPSGGSYDPCNNTFSYQLVQSLFTGGWTADVELVPNN